MATPPAPLVALVRRRLSRYVRAHSETALPLPFASTVHELACIADQNFCSGRYERFKQHHLSTLRLTPTHYVDRIIETWISEARRWHALSRRDADAWDALRMQLTRVAAGMIYSRARYRRHAAPDVAQRACIQILKSDYPFDVLFEAWAFRIVRRLLTAEARLTQDVFDHAPLSLEEVASAFANDGAGGAGSPLADPLARVMFEAVDHRDLLVQALSQLKPPRREVIVLSFFAGWDDAAIARHLNTSRGGVHTLRHRALAQLSQLLEEA